MKPRPPEKLDILKIPGRTPLTYSEQELEALKVTNLDFIVANTPGFGGSATFGRVRRILETPIDEATRDYRLQFFSELMDAPDFLRKVQGLARAIPDSKIYSSRWRENGEVEKARALAAERLANFPLVLAEIENLDSRSSVAHDLKKYARQVLFQSPDFLEATRKVREEYPPRGVVELRARDTGRPRRLFEIDEENLAAAASLLEHFPEFAEYGRVLKEQLAGYLALAYICEDGARPKFLDPEERRGRIGNAVHRAYEKCDYSRSRTARIRPVPNDAGWGPEKRTTMITGSNSMGKSVYLRTIGINILLPMNGFYALADEIEFSPVRRLWPCFDFGDSAGKGHLETGQAYVARMNRDANLYDLLLIDEPSSGTEPEVERALSEGLIKFAQAAGFNSFVVTHDVGLVREFQGTPCVAFRRVADYDDPSNKYRILEGISQGGYGMALARRLGTDPEGLMETLRQRQATGEL
ncbi:MAG: hypothetical protein V1820_06605 [archaeon]